MSNKKYTFEQEEVSDLHKEIHNIRPNHDWWENWYMSSDEIKQKIWNDMIEKSLRNV